MGVIWILKQVDVDIMFNGLHSTHASLINKVRIVILRCSKREQCVDEVRQKLYTKLQKWRQLGTYFVFK